MLKSLLLLAVAISLVILFVYIKMDFSVSFILIFVIVFITNSAYSFFQVNPFQYLSEMTIDNNDPLIKEAEQKSKDTFEQFIKDLYPAHKDDAIIKINYTNQLNECEKIWGELKEIQEDSYAIHISTPPKDPRDDYQPSFHVKKNDIIDWCVELKDGSLRGGFSNLALFKIYEREKGGMHPKFAKHIKLFKSL